MLCHTLLRAQLHYSNQLPAHFDRKLRNQISVKPEPRRKRGVVSRHFVKPFSRGAGGVGGKAKGFFCWCLPAAEGAKPFWKK